MGMRSQAKFTPDQVRRMQQMVDQGFTLVAVSQRFGKSTNAVKAALKSAGSYAGRQPVEDRPVSEERGKALRREIARLKHALQLVARGIRREDERCWLTGDSTVVHAVEMALRGHKCRRAKATESEPDEVDPGGWSVGTIHSDSPIDHPD